MPLPTLPLSTDYVIPAGYGFRRLSPRELAERDDLLSTLNIFEHPRTRGERRYIVSADVSDGLGLDRSSVDVVRMGTVEEPAMQVAHYLTDSLPPMALAFIIDAVGHLYKDADGYEAIVAIECNNHGLSTQDTLQLHLGYTHFYRWEYYDAADAGRRFSNKIGWVTTSRTRPIILDKLYSSITTLDPITNEPDLIILSPFTINELVDFQTDGALWEAEAARGAHDDCVLSLAIGNYVAWRLAGGEREPLSERRHRLMEERIRRAATGQAKPDWRNTPCTAAEAAAGVDPDEESIHATEAEYGFY